MGSRDLPPADVTLALLRLVANDGDVTQTASELIDERFQVTEDTLRLWKVDVHREQYRRLMQQHALALEEEAVAQARDTIRRVGELSGDLIERVGLIRDSREAPNALRAMSDARAKAINGLLQLTGRPVDGKQPASTGAEALMQMVDRGYLRLAPGVTLSPDPPIPVPNQAETSA